jgi:cellulose biosynthesis protein BcsQ
MKIITFFNNKGGVGKSTLSMHVGYCLEQLGRRVLFIDADPQCNLSAHICPENVIETAWQGNSIYQAVHPLVTGSGDIQSVQPYQVPGRNIWVLIGDLLLTDFESMLGSSWTEVLAAQERGFRASSGLYRAMQAIGRELQIDEIIIDIGPNLGSLNRVMLLGSDYYFVPLIPDLFSLRGTQNMGRVLADWINRWAEAVVRFNNSSLEIPIGRPIFGGYISQQFNIYRQAATKAWERWANEIPHYIHDYIVAPLLQTPNGQSLVHADAERIIGEVKNYHSLIPMAQDSLKPIFELTGNDGVKGAHFEYVTEARARFTSITQEIARRL